jgi:hypothetical protein
LAVSIGPVKALRPACDSNAVVSGKVPAAHYH